MGNELLVSEGQGWQKSHLTPQPPHVSSDAKCYVGEVRKAFCIPEEGMACVSHCVPAPVT